MPVQMRIRYGVDRLPAGRRKERLQATAAEVFAAVTNHVLPFDAAAALEYDGIVCDHERAGALIEVSMLRSPRSAV